MGALRHKYSARSQRCILAPGLGDYLYSSARSYYNLPEMFPVLRVELLLV